MRVETASAPVVTRYFHKDHLGSITAITNAAGAVVERAGHDAWGRRRHPGGADDPAGTLESQTNRGFTGHEEFDSVGLVHMNGRVYDPILARFTSADPVTEDPFSTQGMNRYSYVGNSPTNHTDPSGYCFMGCGIGKSWRSVQRAVASSPLLRSVIQIAAGVACTLVTGGNVPLCAVVAGAVTATLTGISGGSLSQSIRAGLITTASALAFHVGTQFASSAMTISGPPAIGHEVPANSGGMHIPTSDVGTIDIGAATQLPGIVVSPAAPTPAATPAPTSEYWDDFVSYLNKSWYSLSRAPADIAGIASDFVGSPLATTASVLGGLPMGKTVGTGLKAGQAGSFRSLSALGSKGDNLTPHHMPQAALNFTTRAEGGALMLPHSEHVLTRTYMAKGALTARVDSGLPFRSVLAKDISDIRNLFGTRYNDGMLDLIDYYRKTHPDLLIKK